MVEQAYDAFDLTDWAWEYLRRNPDYQADWRAAVPKHFPAITLCDGTTVLRLRRRYHSAERWGLQAFADPAQRARAGPVFWHPEAWRGVIRMNCHQPTQRRDRSPLSLAQFCAQRFAIVAIDGTTTLTLKGYGVAVGLIVQGWEVLTRPVVATIELEAFHEFASQLECLRVLQRLAEPSSQSAINRSQWGPAGRLHQALIALDGSLAGASYRTIADMIFGEARVNGEWNAASRFLKDRVRRLVGKGHELMNGGYRELLK